MRSSKHRFPIATGLCVLAGAFLLTHGVNGGAEATAGQARSCFPASKWGPAPDSIRPCVRVVRVEEDGSFSFVVSDANGNVRYESGVESLDQ